ncbi:MAG: hypothetical protein ACOYKZ_04295 [Chlamydiia bacterium]
MSSVERRGFCDYTMDPVLASSTPRRAIQNFLHCEGGTIAKLCVVAAALTAALTVIQVLPVLAGCTAIAALAILALAAKYAARERTIDITDPKLSVRLANLSVPIKNWLLGHGIIIRGDGVIELPWLARIQRRQGSSPDNRPCSQLQIDCSEPATYDPEEGGGYYHMLATIQEVDGNIEVLDASGNRIPS